MLMKKSSEEQDAYRLNEIAGIFILSPVVSTEIRPLLPKLRKKKNLLIDVKKENDMGI